MTHPHEPLATVVIPARNAEAWIGEQLQSLAEQVDAPPFDVVVADNGSTDGTARTAANAMVPFEVCLLYTSPSPRDRG